MLEDQELSQLAVNAPATLSLAGALRRVQIEPSRKAVAEAGGRFTIVLEDGKARLLGSPAVADNFFEVGGGFDKAGETPVPGFIFATEDQLAHSDDPEP